MRMYRICHKVTARGVYSHNSYCYQKDLSQYHYDELDRMAERHGSSDNIKRTPCRGDEQWIEDTMDKPLCFWDLIYGFNSLEQLKRWFNYEELEMLHNYGFHIITLEVNNYCLYSKQMVVDLNDFLNYDVVEVLNINEI